MAADEILVDAFLKGQIGFSDIPRVLYSVLAAHKGMQVSLESIHEAMDWAERQTRIQIGVVSV